MRFDTGAVIGYFQAADDDIAAATEVYDLRRMFAAPQLRRRGAAGVPAGPENSRRLRRKPARDRRHEAIPGPIRVAGRIRLRAWRIRAHLVGAGIDDQRVAAMERQGGIRAVALRRKRVERMMPAAILRDAAARVLRIGESVALGGGTAIGADVVRRPERMGEHEQEGERAEKSFHC